MPTCRSVRCHRSGCPARLAGVTRCGRSASVDARPVEILARRIVGRRNEVEPLAGIVGGNLGDDVGWKICDERRLAVRQRDDVGVTPTVPLAQPQQTFAVLLPSPASEHNPPTPRSLSSNNVRTAPVCTSANITWFRFCKRLRYSRTNCWLEFFTHSIRGT